MDGVVELMFVEFLADACDESEFAFRIHLAEHGSDASVGGVGVDDERLVGVGERQDDELEDVGLEVLEGLLLGLPPGEGPLLGE